MKILAIETSCDETAASILEDTSGRLRVLSNVISSQIAIHAPFGGVVPSLAAREHAINIGQVFQQAMAEVFGHWRLNGGSSPVDLIAVTHGPGLGPALLVGITFARTLAWLWNTPLLGINHMDGHVHSNWLDQEIHSVTFPALNLIVSGGHTELVLMQSHTKYKIIGETKDDAIGEAFDKVARLLGLGYPGGPAITALARSGNPYAYNLPRPMWKSPDYHFSYSGLKTAVLYLIRDLTQGTRELTDDEKANIAASFQHAAIDVLIQKTRLAAEYHQPKTILLSGGVSANPILREQLHQLATELGMAYRCPEMKYTTDNAAMIAAAAYFKYMENKTESFGWDSVHMDANLTLGASSNAYTDATTPTGGPTPANA